MNTDISFDEKLDHIYRLLIGLTEGEEDPELMVYYETVISYCEELRELVLISQTKQVTITLPLALYYLLQGNAKKNECTVHELLEDMVTYYLTSDYTD